jgi:hypothetical protein
MLKRASSVILALLSLGPAVAGAETELEPERVP